MTVGIELIIKATQYQIQILYLQTLQVQKDLLTKEETIYQVILQISQLASHLEMGYTDPNAQSRVFLKDAWSPLILKCSDRSLNGNKRRAFYHGTEMIPSWKPKVWSMAGMYQITYKN